MEPSSRRFGTSAVFVTALVGIAIGIAVSLNMGSAGRADVAGAGGDDNGCRQWLAQQLGRIKASHEGGGTGGGEQRNAAFTAPAAFEAGDTGGDGGSTGGGTGLGNSCFVGGFPNEGASCTDADGYEGTCSDTGVCVKNICQDDGYCDSDEGETEDNCPADCLGCGDEFGYCSATERISESCPLDCGYCGDNKCETTKPKDYRYNPAAPYYNHFCYVDCNGNGECEEHFEQYGESHGDCGYCGDDECVFSQGETPYICPEDCGEPVSAGELCLDDTDCAEFLRCATSGLRQDTCVECEIGDHCPLGYECLDNQCDFIVNPPPPPPPPPEPGVPPPPPPGLIGAACEDNNECESNHCGSFGPKRDTCVECKSSRHCPADRSICIPSTAGDYPFERRNTCVVCKKDNDCGPGGICNNYDMCNFTTEDAVCFGVEDDVPCTIFGRSGFCSGGICLYDAPSADTGGDIDSGDSGGGDSSEGLAPTDTNSFEAAPAFAPIRGSTSDTQCIAIRDDGKDCTVNGNPGMCYDGDCYEFALQ